MEVERDGGEGTAVSHWDEDLFNQELMTGYQDSGEHVLPVTIDVLKLLGHQVNQRLDRQTPLRELLASVESMVFSRQGEVRNIDLNYFEKTDLFENIPHSYRIFSLITYL